MSELRLIPGPDKGACPTCGQWRRAGLRHHCTVKPDLTAVQTALRDAESHVQQRRQELQQAVLEARQSRSLADIARELGVSKQRVDQISRGK